MAKTRIDTSATALAARQMTLDVERTRRFPALLARKDARMMMSPLAFLRGAAPVFYEILASRPDLRDGPKGEGWLAGDLHLENFGAYRTHPLHDKDDEVVFGLNDFDDAFVGPFYYDVLRLITSLLLGGREMRLRGPDAVALGHGLLDSYVGAAFMGKALPKAPLPVERLLDQVKKRTRLQFLDSRTTIVRKERKFTRGPRYESVSDELQKKAKKAFDTYAKDLTKRGEAKGEHLEVTDLALRIAGTGSLGGLRVAVLVCGHGGKDGGFIFDMKEQGTPSSAVVVKPPKLAPAERVITAIRACNETPPTLLGQTTLGKSSMFVRKLMPQEDKVDFTRLAPADIAPLANYLGALVGKAHARGQKKMPKSPWSRGDREHVIHAAIELAGMHEGAYLAIAETLLHKSGK
jgi:uncharacterized protein (DUF2252 family)